MVSVHLEYKKNRKEKKQGENTVFDRIMARCESHGDAFGESFLDYQNVNVEELTCYMNMAFCGTSNIRFKEKMFCEKLSEALTVSEEAFGILVFENCYKRWLYLVEEEVKNNKSNDDTSEEGSEETNQVNNDDDDDDISGYNSDSEGGKVPAVLYQTKVIRKKDNRETVGAWTDEGYKRYNELIGMVRDSRNSDWRKGFEEDLQKYYIERADGKLKAYKRRMKIKQDMLKPKKRKVAPKNMFDAMLL